MIFNLFSSSENLGIELQLDTAISDKHTFTLGLTARRKSVFDVATNANYHPITYAPIGPVQDTGPFVSPSSRTIGALYVQDVIQATDSIEATFGLRYDRYSDFGGALNPRAGIVWTVNPDTHYKLLYGTAFKAPNHQELYLTNNPVLQGDDSLNPSKIKTLETSLSHKLSKQMSGTISLFRTEIDDIIGVVAGNYANTGKQEFRGAELEFKIGKKSSHYAYLNYTRTKARDVSNDARLPGIAEHRGNIGFNVKMSPQLNWNSNIHYTSSRSRFDGDNRDKVSAYTLINTTFIASNKSQDKTLRVSFRNLNNTQYADPDPSQILVDDYPNLGRNVLLEGKVKF
jgi:iron complex outermembrane receptor protein